MKRSLAHSLVLLVLALAVPAQGHAQQVVANLTQNLVAITTGFTGATVTLFGATESPADIVVLVQGPTRDIIVRHKSKIAAIWVNATQVNFRSVPSFYSIASSKPLDQIASPELLRSQQIGIENLRLTPDGNLPAEQASEFRDALIRNQERAALYLPTPGEVKTVGAHLFHTTIAFPANVPTGDFLVQIFVMRDGALLAAQTLPLTVSQVGFDAEVRDFANRYALAYGVIAVALAALAGWLASLPFRNA